MMQKRIGPATRGDTFASRRRFPSTPSTAKTPSVAKKTASQNPPAEAAQSEG